MKQALKIKRSLTSTLTWIYFLTMVFTLKSAGVAAFPGEPSSIENKSEEWIPLFNGTSLEGWHVACHDEDKGKNFFRVVEGTIEVNFMGHPDHDYIWLCTDKEYADFEMKLRFRVFRDNKGNSGVQVRSRYDRSPDAPKGGWLDCPQVDIHPKGPWRNGLVYDETREARGWIYPYRPESGIKEELVNHEVVFKYS